MQKKKNRIHAKMRIFEKNFKKAKPVAEHCNGELVAAKDRATNRNDATEKRNKTKMNFVIFFFSSFVSSSESRAKKLCCRSELTS